MGNLAQMKDKGLRDPLGLVGVVDRDFEAILEQLGSGNLADGRGDTDDSMVVFNQSDMFRQREDWNGTELCLQATNQLSI